MKLQPDRSEKIKALLGSPVAGEREAARAALARIDIRPQKGTPEWREAILEWNRKIEWAMSRLGAPSLTAAEQRTIRNFGKYRGHPWSQGSDAFLGVFRKLQRIEKFRPDNPAALTMEIR